MSRFEKVTLNRWIEDSGINGLSDAELAEWYDEIKLPKQSTAASAGCDFFMPFNLNFEPHSTFRIATGVRWVTDACASAGVSGEADAADAGVGAEGPADKNKVLLLVPRSGLGFKYGIRLSNTIGVIDADYCGSDNEGHIIISLENPSDKTVALEAGRPFCQGIVVCYETPEGAESNEVRNGGLGSTDRR